MLIQFTRMLCSSQTSSKVKFSIVAFFITCLCQPLCNYEITSRFQPHSLKVELPTAGVAWEHLDHLNLGTAQHSIGDCKLVKLTDALGCAEGKENEVHTWNSTECKLILTKARPNSELRNPENVSESQLRLWIYPCSTAEKEAIKTPHHALHMPGARHEVYFAYLHC